MTVNELVDKLESRFVSFNLSTNVSYIIKKKLKDHIWARKRADGYIIEMIHSAAGERNPLLIIVGFDLYND